MLQKYELPTYVHQKIEELFQMNKWHWSAKRLAEDVLHLSDFYIHNPQAPTPWDQSWAQRALLTYYWPLNTIRLQKVLDELKAVNFFSEIENFVDFGAGPGTASWLLKDLKIPVTALEVSPVPQKWFPELNWSQKSNFRKNTCVIFSYALTELNDLPEETKNCDSLLIIEPSTQADGRRLMELRKKLLSQGYSVWAPCSHQEACPQLEMSKTDWCHDRAHFQAPQWFVDIEKYLPMKNKTLTMSYLAVKKQKPSPPSWARLTGDSMKEKGKTRQMICRGPQREFLAWMHRDGEPPEYFRGERVVLESFEPKSNELRVQSIKRSP